LVGTPVLNLRAARDIDTAVAKVLRGLGDPEPPLRLELVRELLSLDRQYYSSSDTGALQEALHRLRVGAKQVILRPGLLLDIVRKRELSALWIPDRRRILIDSELPAPKHRWSEGHEIGHSLIPWHADVAHGDHRLTLSLACEMEIEAEANYAAGRLLFLRERFSEELFDGPIDFTRIRALSKRFGNTMTSTLWRTVESLDIPAFGLVSQHLLASRVDPTKPWVEHLVTAPAFRTMFSVFASDVYLKLRPLCRGAQGPIARGEIIIQDVDGDDHVFGVECFYNGHSTLTLGLHRGVRRLVIGVVS
jgi:hypothetical protein